MFDGTRYLIAPRSHTQWVRNLRAAGESQLLLGGRRKHFPAAEPPDTDKEPDPARLPEAPEMGGRPLLRRDRRNIADRGTSPHRAGSPDLLD